MGRYGGDVLLQHAARCSLNRVISEVDVLISVTLVVYGQLNTACDHDIACTSIHPTACDTVRMS